MPNTWRKFESLGNLDTRNLIARKVNNETLSVAFDEAKKNK